MNFGNWVVVSFLLFAVFIGTLVIVCIRQDVNLVSKNYYQEELRHQYKMDQLKNTNSLAVKPTITLERDTIRVYFPEFIRMESGELQLLRPSDDRLDQRFQLKATQDSVQVFHLNRYEKGLYRVRMRWTSQSRDYLLENQLVK